MRTLLVTAVFLTGGWLLAGVPTTSAPASRAATRPATRPSTRPSTGPGPATAPANRPAAGGAFATASAKFQGSGQTAFVALEVKGLQPGGVAAGFDNGKALVTVGSTSGIGKAIVRRTSPGWPGEMKLRVRLGGLESFTISSGETVLSISFSSHPPHAATVRLVTDGAEGPALGADSPYWTQVRAFTPAGLPVQGLPPRGGYFELTVPKPLLDDKSDWLRLRWIDFYRS